MNTKLLSYVVLGQVIRLALSFLIIDFLSKENFAEYTIMMSYISIISFLFDYGISTRILTIEEKEKIEIFIRSIFTICSILQVFLIIILINFQTVIILALTISIFSFQTVVLSAYYKRLDKPIIAAIFENIIRSVPFISALTIAYILHIDKKFNLYLSASAIIISIFYILFFIKNIRIINFSNLIIKQNTEIWITGVLVTLLSVLDVWTLNYFSSPNILSDYRIHFQFSQLAILPLSIVGLLYSGKFLNNNHIVFKKARNMSRKLSAASCFVVLFLTPFIINEFFGDKYEVNFYYLIPMVFIMFINSFYGPIGLYANINNFSKQYRSFLIEAILIFCLITIISFPFIKEFSVIIGNLASIFWWNYKTTNFIINEK